MILQRYYILSWICYSITIQYSILLTFVLSFIVEECQCHHSVLYSNSIPLKRLLSPATDIKTSAVPRDRHTSRSHPTFIVQYATTNMQQQKVSRVLMETKTSRQHPNPTTLRQALRIQQNPTQPPNTMARLIALHHTRSLTVTPGSHQGT